MRKYLGMKAAAIKQRVGLSAKKDDVSARRPVPFQLRLGSRICFSEAPFLLAQGYFGTTHPGVEALLVGYSETPVAGMDAWRLYVEDRHNGRAFMLLAILGEEEAETPEIFLFAVQEDVPLYYAALKDAPRSADDSETADFWIGEVQGIIGLPLFSTPDELTYERVWSPERGDVRIDPLAYLEQVQKGEDTCTVEHLGEMLYVHTYKNGNDAFDEFLLPSVEREAEHFRARGVDRDAARTRGPVLSRRPVDCICGCCAPDTTRPIGEIMLDKLAFWKNYGEGKLAQAGDALLTKMVELDPAGMSRAEIESEREKFENFSRDVEDYRGAYQREAAEAEAARAAYNTKMAQIAALEHAADNVVDPAKGDKLRAAADKLRNEAAELLGIARTEIEEAELAKQDLDEVEAIQSEMAQTIKVLESSLQKAQADMERANRAKDRAEKRAAHQERLAGIRGDSGSVGTASKVMREQAEKARRDANAATRRSELLNDAKDSKDESFVDADVAAVLREVDNAGTRPPTPLPDRL